MNTIICNLDYPFITPELLKYSNFNEIRFLDLLLERVHSVK